MSYARDCVELGKLRGESFARRGFSDVLLSGLSRLPSPTTRPSFEIYCHYVFDDQVAAFRQLMEFLAKRGRFVDAGEVLAVALGQRELEGACFHISFDDGHRNVVDNALPVMRDFGAAGTFFIPTALISANYAETEKFCRETLHLPRAIEMATWDDLARAPGRAWRSPHTRAITCVSAKIPRQKRNSKTKFRPRRKKSSAASAAAAGISRGHTGARPT